MVVYGVWVYFRQIENRWQYAVIEGRPVETNGNVDGGELLHDQSAHGGITRHGRIFTKGVLMADANSFSAPCFTGPRNYRLVVANDNIVRV